MRQSWKEFGLGWLNFLWIMLVIVLVQFGSRRFAPAAGPFLFVLLIVPAYYFGCRWIEHRATPELAPKPALYEVPLGIAAGIALFAAVMAILWAGGFYHAAGRGAVQHLGKAFAFTVLAGVVEEIVFRGLLYRIFTRLLGTWAALGITSAFFGAAHAANPGATFWSSLAIAIEAGIMLGAAYSFAGRLWLPIAIHIGWNFCEGSVFGVAVSGNAMEPGLIHGTLQGPAVWTGGAFGPEASLTAVVVCLSLAVFFLYKIVRQRRIEGPAWQRVGT